MGNIRLFWWNEIRLMKKPKENYGDALGPYLVKKISGRNVVWIHPKKFYFKNLWQPIYATVGSILAHVNENCIVWGSGIINKDQVVKSAKFLAVRGPQTRNNLLAQGYDVPEIYGDPALLMPKYYGPSIKKKYRFAIVPHYNDYKEINTRFEKTSDIIIIDLMTSNIEATTNLFLQSERIISSSLHGLIIAHSYQIPAVWVEFSDKLFGDGIKFQDYFESVNLDYYVPEKVSNWTDLQNVLKNFDSYPNLPKADQIESLQEGLLEVCPFKNF